MLPRAPVLAVAPRHAAWLDEHGTLARLTHGEAAERLAAGGRPPYVCHAKATARRLGLHTLAALDVLELFAFVHPARPAVPTVRGLARALGLALPASIEDEASTLLRAAETLLVALSAPGLAGEKDAPAIARTMARAGWLWGDAAVAALAAGGRSAPGAGRTGDGGALAVWTRLKEWQESAPPPAPGHDPVPTAAARQRLAHLLGEGAEPRPEQADYASAACAAFDPIEAEEEPHVVLAEAGTGVGKTLGYIAPASLWAERNEGTVWLSTFTRNLQRQIDQELDRLYPEPRVKAEKVVLRKGRENYLCLLNMEEALGRSALMTGDRIALGLMARWAAATRDGDITGGDLPAWLADLLGYGRTLGLADRRGECIHSACTHYRRCFIEKSQRKARRADMVIANHALLMVQAARAAFGTGEERGVPVAFFHGRGGSSSRGGMPAGRAIAAQPPGTIGGRMRLTEQGEVVSGKYANRGYAETQLEILAASVLEHSLPGDENRHPGFEEAMEALSKLSYTAYRKLGDHPGLVMFYQDASPVEELALLKIGSRPMRRFGANTLDDLRAIPWVFAWTQTG